MQEQEQLDRWHPRRVRRRVARRHRHQLRSSCLDGRSAAHANVLPQSEFERCQHGLAMHPGKPSASDCGCDARPWHARHIHASGHVIWQNGQGDPNTLAASGCGQPRRDSQRGHDNHPHMNAEGNARRDPNRAAGKEQRCCVAVPRQPKHRGWRPPSGDASHA